MSKLQDYFSLVKNSFTDLNNNDPLQLAAATAFFCLFALPPILIIIIAILGLFLTSSDLSNTVFQSLAGALGESGSEQIKEIFSNFRALADDILTTVLVAIFLIFIATNLFVTVQKNVNQLWNIQVHNSQSLISKLRSRLIAMIQVLIGGAIIFAALLVDAAVALVGDGFNNLFPDLNLPVIKLLNQVLSFAIVTLWFTLLYKVLPNAYIHWKPALAGGIITAILFTIGKLILGFVLINSNIDNIFGAAGSIILVLLFIFYSSLIFYFGATLTKYYGEYIGDPIQADKLSEITDQ